MTISLDIQSCLGNRSGVGMFTYELARHLEPEAGMDFQGNIFNFRHRRDDLCRELDLPFQIRECTKIPYSAYRLAQVFSALPYSSLFGKTEISIFFNYVVPAGVSGKVISTVYDMTYMRFPETMNRRNFLHLKSQMDRSLDRCDHIITISEFSKREIMELLCVPEDMISVISCAAPDSCENCGDPVDLETRFGISYPYILFVGNIEPRKNLERLLRAFDYFKNETGMPHKLVMAGGSGWRNENIYRASENITHSGDVIFTGYISEREKNVLYRKASLFVYPSLYEGFGLPPLEAMQNGCPVVCSNAASLPEVVGDAALMTDPYDEKALAEAISRVLSEDALRSSLVSSGYKRVQSFTWHESSCRLKSVCKKVMESS